MLDLGIRKLLGRNLSSGAMNIGSRIHDSAILVNFEVDVRARGSAGRAD